MANISNYLQIIQSLNLQYNVPLQCSPSWIASCYTLCSLNLTPSKTSHFNKVFEKFFGLHVVMCVMHRSAVKVISQPNPQFGHGNDNPLSILGQALFPPGSTNAPMEQLQQFYRLGVQAMSKAQSAGGETRSNSVSVFTGMLISVITNVQCLKWKKKCLDAPTQAPLLALLPPLPSSTTRSRVPKW